MRIGISVSRVSSTPRTGVARYVQGLVEAIQRVDGAHEYVLIGGDPPPAPLPTNFSWRPGASGGNLSRILWDHSRIKTEARALRLDALLATKSVLPRSLPCRGVATIHDLAFLRHPVQYPWDFRLYWNRVMRGMVDSDHDFLCDSAATARDMVELLDAPAHRVHTVPLGIDPKRFAAPPEELVRRRLAAHRLDGPFVLFVGNVIPRKNVSRLVEAMRLVRRRTGVRLAVAGENLMKLRFEPEVAALGNVSDQDLACLYAGAEALVFPSLYEGFGFPILEAMAAGCPVVASDRGSLREVGGTDMVTVDPENVESIARGILWILENPALAAALRAAGLARANRFNWDTVARRTLEVLTGARERRAAG